MVAISIGMKVSWSSVLYGIFTAMIANHAKQSQGFSMQINRLLKRFSGVDLWESSTLHPLKVLNTKLVHTYKAKNPTSVSEFLVVTEEEGEKKKKTIVH
ncbi:hypothetical protein F511_25610 [Dorcoceras hygrometricum]|uniref:Uncharacterized protein n=1 Tax=Dorcoceras hygrometricum TaxID=472368 RepID=A0A2Z7CZC5_9LAMI|nr:hypothetical protein F511_25610 [Dorcoceras hygrometricum]